jgi:hypothetical protein
MPRRPTGGGAAGDANGRGRRTREQHGTTAVLACGTGERGEVGSGGAAEYGSGGGRFALGRSCGRRERWRAAGIKREGRGGGVGARDWTGAHRRRRNAAAGGRAEGEAAAGGRGRGGARVREKANGGV